jgi:hypothetical protein
MEAQVLSLVAKGIPYAVIGERVGKSKSAIAGIVYRHRKPYVPTGTKGHPRINDLWTEERLTEKWADRKKRGSSEISLV